MRLFFVTLIISQLARSCLAQECISDLDIIQDAEIAVLPDGLDKPRVYTLCPNKEYVTKFVVPDEDPTNLPGQNAIFVRSGATVKCGDDGALSNNCTITGGKFGASIRYLLRFDKDYPKKLNARIQGIRFEGLESPLQIRGYNEGEMVIEDCVISGTRSNLPFILSGDEVVIEGAENPTGNPDLTDCDLTADRNEFNFTFVNTTFENNGQLVDDNPSVFTTTFVITVCPGQTLVFRDCIFRNNDFARDEKTGETALIAAFTRDESPKTGGIVLERTCFLNNKVFGGYPVLAESKPGDTDFLVSIDSYVDEASIGAVPLCDGFAIFDHLAEETVVLKCVEPGSSFCPLLATDPPSSAPSSTPITETPGTPAPTPASGVKKAYDVAADLLVFSAAVATGLATGFF